MRDVVDLSGTFPARTLSSYKNGATSGGTSNVVTKTVYSRRDDAKHTQPVLGRYVIPTDYWACSSTITQIPYDILVKRTGNQDPYQVRLWSETGAKQNQSMWRAGGDTQGLPVLSNEALNRLRTGLREKIRNSDLDLGVALGEARESFDTVRSLVNDAKRLLRHVRFRRVHVNSYHKSTTWELRRSGTGVAREYLRVIYGIRPIMADIWAALNHSMSELIEGDVAKATYKVRDPNFGPASMLTYGSVWEGEAYREGTISVTYQVANPVLFELWRWGLTNPLSIAWELTTLSFVVDWFTGLGNFIDGLQQPVGIRFLHGFETYYVRCHGTSYSDLSIGYASTYVFPANRFSSARMNRRAFRRVRIYAFTVPTPYLSLGLSDSQLVSGIALIIARLGGR